METEDIFVFGKYQGSHSTFGLYSRDIEPRDLVLGVDNVEVPPLISIKQLEHLTTRLKQLDRGDNIVKLGRYPFIVYYPSVEEGWNISRSAFSISQNDLSKGNILSSICPVCERRHINTKNLVFLSSYIFHYNCVRDLVRALENMWKENARNILTESMS